MTDYKPKEWQDLEELYRQQNVRINELEEENKKLKAELEECECSMHFENDEAGYRKRECKKLKKENEELQEYKRMYEGLG